MFRKLTGGWQTLKIESVISKIVKDTLKWNVKNNIKVSDIQKFSYYVLKRTDRFRPSIHAPTLKNDDRVHQTPLKVKVNENEGRRIQNATRKLYIRYGLQNQVRLGAFSR